MKRERTLKGSRSPDSDSPIRYSHAEAIEILNKPGKYVVAHRARGTTAIVTYNNNNEGFTAEEASALVLKCKGKG